MLFNLCGNVTFDIWSPCWINGTPRLSSTVCKAGKMLEWHTRILQMGSLLWDGELMNFEKVSALRGSSFSCLVFGDNPIWMVSNFVKEKWTSGGAKPLSALIAWLFPSNEWMINVFTLGKHLHSASSALFMFINGVFGMMSHFVISTVVTVWFFCLITSL